MSHTPWIIYGAAGTTGTLIAEEAIRRGHQPLLAGRSAESLASLGKRLGLPWIGGVGFGVVASNGLVTYVADQLPGATTLELVVKANNQQTSQGATKSVLHGLAGGGRVYRNGHLVPIRLGKGLKAFRFPDGTF